MTYIIEGESRYFDRLWRFRHLVWHLASVDLRARFRRSFFGIFWAMLQPLFLVGILTVVFTTFSADPWQKYFVYVFSGLVLWNFISESITLGASSIENAAGYLRQTRIPIIIFPTRAVMHSLVIALTGILSLFICTIIVSPQAIDWKWLLTPLIFAHLAFFILPLAIISAFIALRFRDFHNFLTLILQAFWFFSPVFIMREVFEKPGLKQFTELNPVAAYCDTFRAILIEHSFPHIQSLVLLTGYIILLWLMAIWLLRREENKVIWYL